LNKHLHKMGLLSDPTCAACSIEEESALHLNACAQLSKPKNSDLLSVGEYEERSAGFFVQFAEKSGRFETRG
jgi:hypothetical protein